MAFTMAFWKSLFGDENAAALKRAEPIVPRVNGLEEATRALSDDGLRQKALEQKARVEKGESLDDVAPEAFALAREAARRSLGQRHFDVQIIGGAILHSGGIAEVRTGEGKTLGASLPPVL